MDGRDAAGRGLGADTIAVPRAASAGRPPSNLPFELFVALRYLLARRKQAFISLISAISTLGVAVGVAALVLALALMTGLQGELRDRIVGSAAHIYVWRVGQGGIAEYQQEAQRLRSVPHVLGAAPAVLGKALVTTGRGEAFITVKGIDPSLETQVTEIGRAMQSGRLTDLHSNADGLDGIVIGRELATNLGAFVGDTLTVLTPQGTLSPMGMMPRSRRFKVVGLFSLGLFEFDSAYGFVSLDVAQRLLDKAHPDFMQLRVDDIYAAPDIAATVTDQLGKDYVTEDWSDMNRSLFSALWLEKMAISITIGLIVMVAALNIIASLVLLVMEKSRDIAILKTMGASKRSITVIFMLQGLIIGLVGTAVGATAGYALASVLDRYKLIRIPMDVYQVSYVPFTIQPRDFALVVGAAVLICFFATIYPSRQAARLDPAQALRYQ
jgi:lipoprotein-releasing system permease protein